MIDNAACVCMSQWPSWAIAHGHDWNALSIGLTDIIGNTGALETRIRLAVQGTSVPISRGSPSVSSA
ncbi:MAG TPA: hypothetical protein VGL94_12425 [Ktedonobacteraceae bacterium]